MNPSNYYKKNPGIVANKKNEIPIFESTRQCSPAQPYIKNDK
jgi:hypothetical protein